LTDRPRVGLLHYTCPPVVGGVETILYEQATRLAAHGYPVTILSGRGGPLPDAETVKLVLIPELDSRHPEVTAVREQLLQGDVPPAFTILRGRIERELDRVLEDLDVVIVHNALSLHFNLPLTSALWSIAPRRTARIISWVHDLSWVNPLYRPWMHEGEPWDLLRRSNPRITPVFVSRQRLEEWRELTGALVDERHVIPNGIDAQALLRLGPTSRELAARFGLLEADVVLLAPVRITRRKNLEWAIEAAAGVRDTGQRVRLLITGPPGPHDPRSMEYVSELKQLTSRLALDDSVIFLFEALASSRPAGAAVHSVSSETLSDLYMLSDVVVLPSASEGFGLPLAEAAIFRTPVVCTDIPAFLELAPEGAIVVPVAGGSPGFTRAVLQAIDAPIARLRRYVLGALSWDRLLSERIEPLLAAP
jgi:glycosyltransferase involved in cell wall biosynthesis